MDEDLICHQCLNEAYLIRLIRRTGVTAECSFCLKKRKAIPFDDLINMVDDVLQKYCHPGAIDEWEREMQHLHNHRVTQAASG